MRAIEYTLPGSAEVYRLITTILDPEQAPAAELAASYHERWEIESTLDELKTHQRGPGMVLRSRHPGGVRQEVYGFLLVHYCIRELMWQAAAHEGVDPDRISFTRTINLIRRQVIAQAAFSPSRLARAFTHGLREILQRLNTRRERVNPRVIKRKMSSWPLKRAQHRNPAKPPEATITIVAATKPAPVKLDLYAIT